MSRATLARYVADGRLSAGKDGNGHNVYDAAELRRVFPDSFDLRHLETDEAPASEGPVSPLETGWQATRLAVLEVEKRHLEGDRDRLREEAERLRRELGEERGRRESERAEFMGLLRQKEETVRLLTDQRQQAEQARRVAEAAAARPRGFWARLLGSA
ncbi:MAG TPA: hypothetical protein VFG47_03980 [Geminicoccaceae bacterium]|nr:hypothetical protein [Geminicoccaceae bacterium]